MDEILPNPKTDAVSVNDLKYAKTVSSNLQIKKLGCSYDWRPV